LFLFPVSDNREAAQLASRMEIRYRSAKTLQATFLERYAENGNVLRSEAGTAYFRRPGKMRWQYELPEKDLFLVDGKTAWFYVPADHTVTRVPAKQSEDLRTPLALLAGQMKVSRVCSHVELAETEKPLRESDAMLKKFSV
jgi:outer membrane lipoprotein carrier protein